MASAASAKPVQSSDSDSEDAPLSSSQGRTRRKRKAPDSGVAPDGSVEESDEEGSEEEEEGSEEEGSEESEEEEGSEEEEEEEESEEGGDESEFEGSSSGEEEEEEGSEEEEEDESEEDESDDSEGAAIDTLMAAKKRSIAAKKAAATRKRNAAAAKRKKAGKAAKPKAPKARTVSNSVSGRSNMEGFTKRKAYFRKVDKAAPLKPQAVCAILSRWHHVMSWPPKEFEESEAAKQPADPEWVMLPGFPGVRCGVMGDATGKVVDLRPKTGRPSYEHLIAMSAKDLKAMWIKAIEGQMAELIAHEGKDSRFVEALKKELAQAKTFAAVKADTEFRQIVKAKRSRNG